MAPKTGPVRLANRPEHSHHAPLSRIDHMAARSRIIGCDRGPEWVLTDPATTSQPAYCTLSGLERLGWLLVARLDLQSSKVTYHIPYTWYASQHGHA